MLAFRQIAPLILNQFGGSRMFIIYMLSGIGGFGHPVLPTFH